MKCVENQLIPVINQQILAFDINKNTVKYSLGNEYNMLVLNTLLVDPQCYEMTVKLVSNNKQTIVGVVSDRHSQQQQACGNTSMCSIYIHASSQLLYRNGFEEKCGIASTSPVSEGTTIKLQMDRKKQLLTLTVTKSGVENLHTIKLGSLKEQNKIYPFVELYNPRAQVEITLK